MQIHSDFHAQESNDNKHKSTSKWWRYNLPSILPIIDIGHFKNRFADNYYYFFLCKQTYYLQVTLFIGE